MKKKLIVATDLSPAATNAANYAADMAMSMNADILLFHVFQVPVSLSEVPLAVNEEEIKHYVETGVIRLKEELSLRTEGKIDIDTLVTPGTFLDRLKSICEDIKPYVVIMGCQGTTASDHLLYGTHAVPALKYLKWPVISVPAGVLYAGIRKIAIACDFDQTTDIFPFEEIKKFVRDLNAQLHVINRTRSTRFDPETIFEAGVLEEMLASLKPEYHFIASKKTDEGIIELVKDLRIDLLIVLPKRHRLINKLIHRSLTKQLVLHSHTPVMALHN